MAEIRVSKCEEVSVTEMPYVFFREERIEGPFKIIYFAYDEMEFVLVLHLSEGKWVPTFIEHMSRDHTCPFCNEKHFRECSESPRYKDELLEEIKELPSFRLTALFEL